MARGTRRASYRSSRAFTKKYDQCVGVRSGTRREYMFEFSEKPPSRKAPIPEVQDFALGGFVVRVA